MLSYSIRSMALRLARATWADGRIEMRTQYANCYWTRQSVSHVAADNITKQYSKSANCYAICTLYHASGSACWSADKVTNSLTLVTCKYSPVTLWTCFALSFPYIWDPWNEEREPRVVRFYCRAGIGEGGMFRRQWHSRKSLEHNLSNLLGLLERMLGVFGVMQAESGGNPLR